MSPDMLTLVAWVLAYERLAARDPGVFEADLWSLDGESLYAMSDTSDENMMTMPECSLLQLNEKNKKRLKKKARKI